MKIIFQGPQGCGKTLVAQAFCNMLSGIGATPNHTTDEEQMQDIVEVTLTEDQKNTLATM